VKTDVNSNVDLLEKLSVRGQCFDGAHRSLDPSCPPRNVAEMQSDWACRACYVSPTCLMRFCFAKKQQVIPDTGCLILVHWQHAAKPLDFRVLYPLKGKHRLCLMLDLGSWWVLVPQWAQWTVRNQRGLSCLPVTVADRPTGKGDLTDAHALYVYIYTCVCAAQW
jgi:hypothetical protein